MSEMVCTYFVDVGAPSAPVREALAVWARSWIRAGYLPHVLTEQEASRHPRYEELKALIASLPTVNLPKYEEACFLRWLALEVVGHPLMVDFDVLNFGLTPELLRADIEAGGAAGQFVILDRSGIPCAVYAGTDTERHQLVDTVFDEKALDAGLVEIDGRPHLSDMTVLQEQKWIPRIPLCDLWPNGLPLRHFQTDVSGGNYVSKVDLMTSMDADYEASLKQP